MDGVGAWLIEHWPAAVSAIAAVATLAVVLRDRRERPEALGAELTVFQGSSSDDLKARVTFLRPGSGFLAFERLEAAGWELSPEIRKMDAYNAPADTGERRWQKSITIPQEYGRPMRSVGQSDLASVEFWVRRRTSSKASNVMRLKLTVRRRSDRTLRSRITIESNAID